MASIDMGVFIQKLYEYIETGPSKSQKEQDEFMSRFFRVYKLLLNTSNQLGYSTKLDMSSISFEDLDWIMDQVESVPDAEVGYYNEPITQEDMLRDRALKMYHRGYLRLFSMDEFNTSTAVRPIENYF